MSDSSSSDDDMPLSVKKTAAAPKKKVHVCVCVCVCVCVRAWVLPRFRSLARNTDPCQEKGPCQEGFHKGAFHFISPDDRHPLLIHFHPTSTEKDLRQKDFDESYS